jgi:NodT family efflux transporter outer membrane factor (OMF) lipoprotein
LPPLEKARAQGRDQLMAYLGRFPSEDKGESVDLDSLSLPRSLPLSVPSVLVRQRPDIRASEAQVHQAGAEVGVAVANQLPSLTLSASGGSQANQFHELFDKNNGMWSVAASIATPIFDAGSLFHTKEAREASFEQAKDTYKSTVITAFQNVADSLKAIQSDATLLKAQLDSENTAAASLQISQAQFQAGAGTFLNVLTAQQALLNARTSRVKAQAMRYADTVALFQSLGGGWWNRVDVKPEANVTSPGIAAVLEPVGALTDLKGTH